MKDTVSIAVRSKDERGRTVTSYVEGNRCDACHGTGYVEVKNMDVMDVCSHCGGRGVIVAKSAPLPQIEWDVSV